MEEFLRLIGPIVREKAHCKKNHMKICLISLIYFTYSSIVFAEDKMNKDPYSKLKEIAKSTSVVKRVKGGSVISVANVKSYKSKNQSKQGLEVYGAGLHPKSCRFALRKLSLYENYHEYVGIIKKSSYNEKNQRVKFFIESSLLPFSMSMNFRLPRIKKEGSYDFTFDKGFLRGLLGKIYAFKIKDKCLLMVTSKFDGPDTGINDTVLEFFSQAVVKLTLENLIRISKTY